MPIYEFYCPQCRRLLNFLSRRVDTRATPACPHCHGTRLVRRAASFAISKARTEPASGESAPDIDEARMEKAMESLAGEMEHMDESDPRGSARLMRRVFETSGMPVPGEMEEALRRMEAGEDPEKVEEEMGNVLDGDPETASEPTGALGSRSRYRGSRRALPTIDPTLYEM